MSSFQLEYAVIILIKLLDSKKNVETSSAEPITYFYFKWDYEAITLIKSINLSSNVNCPLPLPIACLCSQASRLSRYLDILSPHSPSTLREWFIYEVATI
jgi:hypothetical protein